eukprot:845698_1
MTSNKRWPGTPEEGEIIEPRSDLTSNGLLYQFCVPPGLDETQTTDTATTTTTIASTTTIPMKRKAPPSTTDDLDSEPALKRPKVSGCVTIPNVFPTLTLHSPQTKKTRATKPIQSTSPSPIYYYTQNHRHHKVPKGHKVHKGHKARRRRRHRRVLVHSRNGHGYGAPYEDSPPSKRRRRHRSRAHPPHRMDRYHPRPYFSPRRPIRRRRLRSESLSRSPSPPPRRHRHRHRSETDTTSSDADIDLIPHNAQHMIDLTTQTQSRLELLKQKAMESVQLKRDQLNSSGLLKEDSFEHCFNAYSKCKNIVMGIVHRIVPNTSQHVHHCAINMPKRLDTDTTNEVKAFDQDKKDDNLALLRALALKSLTSTVPQTQIQTPKNNSLNHTDTNSVDMEISDAADHDEEEDLKAAELQREEEEKQREIEQQEAMKRHREMEKQRALEQQKEMEKRKQMQEMNAFVIEQQKLTLILSQIRQKTVERKELVHMASLAAQELHTFIDKFKLSTDSFAAHEHLNDLITQHIECPNCRLNNVKNRMELERQKEKHQKKLKQIKRVKATKKKKKKKKTEYIQNESVRVPVLNERINDLGIHPLYRSKGECGDMSLCSAYKHRKEYALVTAKIESNLLLYYQDHLGFVQDHQEKEWNDLDFMKEYTVNELQMLN